MSNSREIIIRPIITEKSMTAAQSKNYTFEVRKNANKTNIKLAIEEIFDVKVENVHVINQKPRPRRVGKYNGYKRSFKKAIVKLTAESKEIALFTQ